MKWGNRGFVMEGAADGGGAPAAGTGTILGGPDSKAAAGAGAPPAGDIPEWITKLIPEDLTYTTPRGAVKVREAEGIHKFKDAGSALKAYLEMEQYRGQSVKLPGENATPEEMNEFFKRLGRPDKPEDYKIQRREGDGILWNAELEGKFRKFAHEHGFNQKQVEALVGFQFENMAGMVQTLKIDQEKAMGSLKELWGQDYDANVEMARRAIRSFATEEEVKFLNESGVGDFVPLIKLSARLGKILAEHNLVGEASTGFVSSEEAKRKLDEIYGNPAHPFFSKPAGDPAHDSAMKEVDRLMKAAGPDPRFSKQKAAK